MRARRRGANMNMEKMQRTLKRELTRNPAKTGTLLALLPVAGYFILPLIWKAVPKSDSAAPAPASFVVVNPATPSTDLAVASAGIPANWRDLAKQIATDQRMKPTADVGERNPFRRIPTAAELAKNESEQPETPVDVRRGPEDFGLQLTATIVGAGQRMATINGRLYRENSEIKLQPQADDAAATLEDPFILRSVNKSFVVLERQGQQFKLAIAKR